MPLKDPPRLLDPGSGAPDFVRQALDAGRADGPRADQLARLAQRLPIGGAPPPDGSGPSPTGGGSPAVPLASIPSALPGAIIGAVLGLAVVGLHAWITRSEPPPAAEREAPAALRVAAPARAAAPERPSIDAAATPQPAATVQAPAAPATPATASAGPAPRSADPPPNGGPAAPAAAGAAPDLAAGASAGNLAAGALALDSETEIQLLQRAQDALGSAPAQALDLVNRHAARFPGAGLGQEREVIAIDALVRLGRTGEARARAAAFAARFPTSAHLRRIDALVPRTGIDSEVHKDPAGPPPTR